MLRMDDRSRVGGSLGEAVNGVAFCNDGKRISIDNCEQGGLGENNYGRGVDHSQLSVDREGTFFRTVGIGRADDVDRRSGIFDE